MTGANEQCMDIDTVTGTTKMEDFDMLSCHNLVDCDPSNTVKVTAEDLGAWLQESLVDSHDGQDFSSEFPSELGQDIQKRNALLLGYQGISNASRRSGNSTESNFSNKALSQNIQELKEDSDLFDKFLLLSNNNVQQQEDPHVTPPLPKRRRTDPSILHKDHHLSRTRIASPSTSSFFRKTVSSTPSHSSPISSSCSSLTCSTTNSVDSFDTSTGPYCFSDKIKKSTISLLTPVVSPTLTVSQGLTSCMNLSEKSEQEIYAWDRRMGLKKNHSKTMRATGQSRKKLQQLQSQVWQREKKQYPARMA